MASLISASEKTGITAAFNDIFDTFKREIVVYKEPIKTVTDLNMDMFYGYDLPYEGEPTNYTYTVVSGTYQAMIRYEDDMHHNTDSSLNTTIPDGEVRVKVKEDAMNFIESGKTEKITMDNKNYNLASEASVAKFLDSTFYVYHLKEIK